MNIDEAFISLLKHDVDVISCESKGDQNVKVKVASGKVFVGTSFDSIFGEIVEQFGSRVPREPSESCRNLELAVEAWELDRLQMQKALSKRSYVKVKKKRQ
jgi:hypothetical protein